MRWPSGSRTYRKKALRDAVTAGTALHVGEVAGGGHHIAQVDDVEGRRHPIGDVVQPRPAAVGEGDIVHAALAVHPGCRDARLGAVALGIFGQAEAERCIEFDRCLHVAGEEVEVVDALRMARRDIGRTAAGCARPGPS